MGSVKVVKIIFSMVSPIGAVDKLAISRPSFYIIELDVDVFRQNAEDVLEGSGHLGSEDTEAGVIRAAEEGGFDVGDFPGVLAAKVEAALIFNSEEKIVYCLQLSPCGY